LRLTIDEWAVTGVTPPYGDGDTVTAHVEHEEDPTWPSHSAGCECKTCSSRAFRKKGSL
jgi:hypothetical protein